jgi:DNA-binding protein H-NS
MLTEPTERMLYMPDLNLDAMSREELTSLRKNIDAAMKSYGDRKRKAALAEIEAALKKHGVSMAELLGNAKKVRQKQKSGTARYRHPENPDITWTGRGRQPAWFREALDRGLAPEAMKG